MSKRKTKVAVLMGGKTPEHEISLISGREVVRHIDKRKYEVFPVVISRDGNIWKYIAIDRLLSLPNPLDFKGTGKEIVTSEYKRLSGTKDLIKKEVEVVFIAMHGPYGEDGTVQGMLELAGISYTGPGVLASALGIDKLMFRRLMASENIPVPKYIAIRKNDSLSGIYRSVGKLPYFVKPYNQGSSVGISFVNSRKELLKALDLAFEYSDIALVDESVQGLELTCGVIGNEKPQALPLVEISPQIGDFFDYDSKYKEGGAEEIVPARISVSLTKKTQKLAIDVYKILGCKGFSRVDFILRNNKYPVVLEINTIPGLTPTSLLPKAARAAGISYSKLIDKIIQYAL